MFKNLFVVFVVVMMAGNSLQQGQGASGMGTVGAGFGVSANMGASAGASGSGGASGGAAGGANAGSSGQSTQTSGK